jgi:hypothetical protein
MNLRGVKSGDIVRLRGDSALWIVIRREGRNLRACMHGRPFTERNIGARDVSDAWRKVQRG